MKGIFIVSLAMRLITVPPILPHNPMIASIHISLIVAQLPRTSRQYPMLHVNPIAHFPQKPSCRATHMTSAIHSVAANLQRHATVYVVSYTKPTSPHPRSQ